MRKLFVLLSVLVSFLATAQTEEPTFASGSHVYVEPSTVLLDNTITIRAKDISGFNFTLTRGTRLTAAFAILEGGANDRIDVWLLDEPNYQRFQAHQPFAFFKGTSGAINKGAKYEFTAPQTSIYYLILDNRRAWLLSRTVRLNVFAVLPEPTPESKNLENSLEKQYQALKKAFIFPDFNIAIRHCGLVNAFSNPNITLCSELINDLGKRHLESAIAFVFFHELGHTLLRGWGLPMWDNEDAADEFATVLMKMGHQENGALQAAQWWAAQTNTQEALSKVWIDDRHTVSPQRARNIIHWLNDSDQLLDRWKRVFIPNMQVDALVQSLKEGGWDEAAIHAELRKRGSNQESSEAKFAPTKSSQPQSVPVTNSCRQTWLGEVCSGQAYSEIKAGKVLMWKDGTCAVSNDGRLACIFGHATITSDCDHTWVGGVCAGQDFRQVLVGEGPQTLRWHGNVCGLNGSDIAACITQEQP